MGLLQLKVSSIKSLLLKNPLTIDKWQYTAHSKVYTGTPKWLSW
uniref:Uncharacterized protein n=1 Tax=Anguilla anguilla TaxID=7936 RepID=A0A0E9X2V2_ANGAN